MSLQAGSVDLEASVQLVGVKGKGGVGKQPLSPASFDDANAKQAGCMASQLLGKWISVECPAEVVGGGCAPFGPEKGFPRRFVGVLARMDSQHLGQMLLSPGKGPGKALTCYMRVVSLLP